MKYVSLVRRYKGRGESLEIYNGELFNTAKDNEIKILGKEKYKYVVSDNIEEWSKKVNHIMRNG